MILVYVLVTLFKPSSGLAEHQGHFVILVLREIYQI